MKLERVFSTIEYKAREPHKNQMFKTIVAFANSFGGRVVIGVSDSGEESDFDTIEKIFQEFGEISVSEVTKRLSTSRVTASRYLSKLRKQGKVHGMGRGPAVSREEGALSERTTHVVIDEARCVSELLNEVQVLIDKGSQRKFIITDSSARKLKRGQALLEFRSAEVDCERDPHTVAKRYF